MHRENRRYPPQNHGQRRPMRTNQIQNGGCGLFFTIDGDDKRAVREAYNLLDVFLPTSNDVLPVGNVEEVLEHKQQDVSDVLSKLCAESGSGDRKRPKNGNNNNVRQLETGVKHTVFFTADGVIHPGNVYQIADEMVEDCQKNQRCRFLAKVLPVEDVVVGDVDNLPVAIKRLVKSHVDQHYDDDLEKRAPTFAAEYKARNSDLLGRKEVIDYVTEAMTELSPKSSVNLERPDLLFCINVLKKTILLSCVRNYAAKNKFSIRVPLNKTQKLLVESEQPKGEVTT